MILIFAREVFVSFVFTGVMTHGISDAGSGAGCDGKTAWQ
jgi:hypothetical protein